MQYYYLSNMAPMNSEGSILFRTKEQLLDIYHKEPSQLMVVFVEARDIKETEKSGIMRTLYL